MLKKEKNTLIVDFEHFGTHVQLVFSLKSRKINSDHDLLYSQVKGQDICKLMKDESFLQVKGHFLTIE